MPEGPTDPDAGAGDIRERDAATGRATRATPRDWLVVYLKGVAMGAADAVPGVSGGTIALITGIYERLIDAIAAVPAHTQDLVGDLTGNPSPVAATRRTLRAMDAPFLVVLVLGILSGVTTLANVIDVALDAYRAPTFAFFFGIILASPVVLRDEVALRDPRPLAAGVAGFLLAFVIGGLPAREAEYALPALFLIGAVAISAMVLPGISGSLVLLIVGAYDTMTGAVSDLTAALVGAAGGNGVGAAVDPLTTLVVFAAGALLGVLTFARAVSWAIDAYRVPTMTFLVGVMLGALRTPVREILASVDRFTPTVLVGLLLAGIAGAVIVLALDRYTADLEYGDGSGKSV